MADFNRNHRRDENRTAILLHGSAGLTSGGRVGVEDHPSFRERDFAVVGQDYRGPVNFGERQIRLSSPRWRTLPDP